METETTIDFVAVAIIAVVVGFIVYEIHSAVSDDSSGWIWGAAGGFIGALFLL